VCRACSILTHDEFLSKVVMRIGYYPGCSLLGTGREYDRSVRKIAPRLDLELVEVEDWNCCGATSAHGTNRMLSIALPLRVLALAEQQGLETVLAPCAACSNRLLTANHQVKAESALLDQANRIIEMSYKGSVRVVNFLGLLRESLMEPLREAATQELAGLRVACYYGCLLLRPPEVVEFDDPEQPSSMETIVRALGARPVEWEFRNECCGAGLTMSQTPLVADLTYKILRHAKAAGADLVAVACPMCHANLDMRQLAANSTYKDDIKERFGSPTLDLPVLYISQLIGLALGFSPREMGITSHFVRWQSGLLSDVQT